MNGGLTEQNVVVAAYDAPDQAGEAIRRLGQSGFDMMKVSVAARPDTADGIVVGYYYGSGRMRYWGPAREFWEPLWDVLSGWAHFVVPGVGALLVAGPLGGWILTALNNSAVFGGLGAFGAGLYSIGIPRDAIPGYEGALKAGGYVLIAHGSSDEVKRCRLALNGGARSF
jgi:hypothetical protein